MEIAFIRHAQPAWIADGHGVNDPGLTDLGQQQAEQVAARLASDGPWDALAISPLIRARQTALPIAAEIGLKPKIVDGISEIEGPDLSGAPAEAISQMFAEQRLRPYDEWWDGFPGGAETFRQFHERVAAAVVEILGAHGIRPRPEPHMWDVTGDARILIVAHGGADAVALGFLLGLDPVPWEWERFKAPHASVSRIAATPLAGHQILALTAFADTAHLTEITY